MLSRRVFLLSSASVLALAPTTLQTSRTPLPTAQIELELIVDRVMESLAVYDPTDWKAFVFPPAFREWKGRSRCEVRSAVIETLVDTFDRARSLGADVAAEEDGCPSFTIQLAIVERLPVTPKKHDQTFFRACQTFASSSA